MKKNLLIVFTLCLQTVFGQTKISGRVTDGKGDGLPLVNVILLDTYDGSSTDVNGNFEFVTAETGNKVLLAKYIGFKEFQQMLALNGKPISLNITLHEAINELEAVTISAGSFTASDQARRTVFKAIDIATTAGATADIAGALNTLPGTQKVGESGRLFVRGGEGTETRTFIDGMGVLDAYSPSAPNTPSRGRFLPFMFKGTSFSTGGYSAEYGQALSSALVLDSKDESEISRTDIGILSVGGDVAHTQAWENGSAAAKIQYTNLRPYMGFINQRIDWISPPASIEGTAAFRQHIGKNGIAKVFGNVNHSNFTLYNHDIDDYGVKQRYDLTNDYQYVNGFYQNAIDDNWLVRGGVSYTYIQNDLQFDNMPGKEVSKGIHAKTVLEGSLNDHIELKSGAEIIDRTYDQHFNYMATGSFHEVITAGFAEADVYASNKFVTRAGGRFEYNAMISQASVDPRISLAYKAGDHGQMSLAYGIFRQSAKNDWLKINHQLQPEKAEHFILNYQRVEDKRTFRIETYYKKYRDLVKFNDGNATDLTNNGYGYAKGIELFWRDNRSLKNTDYWLSYSFLDTKRNYLNFPYAAVPSFASRHNFSAVCKYFVPRLKSQLGFTYSFASGRPYYNPNATGFNADRTPRYQDVSLNVSYLPSASVIIHFSCTNLLGFNNVFGYQYSNKLNESGIYNSKAIVQPAARFLFVGIFITLSKDKSVNQLPSL